MESSEITEDIYNHEEFSASWWSLSRREWEVLYWLTKGYRNIEIASELIIGLKTVERYVNNVYKKLGISACIGGSARTAITYAAWKDGILEVYLDASKPPTMLPDASYRAELDTLIIRVTRLEAALAVEGIDPEYITPIVEFS